VVRSDDGCGNPKEADPEEAQLIRETLTRHQGDIRRVTAALQIPRKTLYDKMTRHGIIPARHRSVDPLPDE
jgi:two-component system C4-dicarboxylate transport response regulator DctD